MARRIERSYELAVEGLTISAALLKRDPDASTATDRLDFIIHEAQECKRLKTLIDKKAAKAAEATNTP